jgi:type IX secretion system PorP/SprF family membrane protein
MKKISILILALTLSMAANAQDIHFSQFYMAPLNLNPAMTGVMNCQQRISGNYRNQWASVLRDKAFQTYQVAYDSKIPVGRYDYIGVGGSLWGDKAGSLNFRTTQLSLDFSYAKKMGGYRKQASYLVMGAELGLAQRGLNTGAAQWGTQNNNGVFDPTIPSGENLFSRDNFMFADVTAGLMWFSVLNDNTNFFIGGV